MQSASACLAALLLSSCAVNASVAPPSSPATTPPKAKADESFTPASSSTRLSLPCMPSEPELDNGLDDDCDGRVDHLPGSIDDALLVTLAHPSMTDVQAALSPPPATQASAESAREHVCEAGAPFALQRLRLAELAPGRTELTLSRGSACGADVTGSVDVSVWLYGKLVGVYGVTLTSGAPVVVGVVDVADAR